MRSAVFFEDVVGAEGINILLRLFSAEECNVDYEFLWIIPC
jgi:hypothetical protein